YAHDAEKARAFFRDMLGLSSVDAGYGWLIFALPPAEIAAHPTDERPVGGQPRIEMYFLCDDLDRTVAELSKKTVNFTGEISEQPWGRLITLEVPGAGLIGLYQPKHPTAV